MRTSERQSGSVIWRQSERGKVEMVWMCTRKRWWIIWENDVEDGAADRRKKRKTTKGVYRFNEGGHEEDWCDRRR